MLRTLAAALAASTLFASAASAATLVLPTWDATPAKAFSNPTISCEAGSTCVDNTSGNIGGVKASPWADANLAYSYITGAGSIAFGRVQQALSFVWGSPDNYNAVEFFLGDDQVASYAYPHTEGRNIEDSLATFSGFTFDRVRFTSGAPAFEFANVSSVAAVPLPAAAPLLVAGLGALGFLRRRRKAA